MVDVRAHPGSRRMPHFGRAELERALPAAGVEYVHVPELGGRRRPVPESPNGAWENAAFQGYADHMATPEFEEGLARAIAAAGGRRTVLMCAEAVWWRCHRRLVADALTVRGWSVWHIVGPDKHCLHELPAFAVADGARLIYPPPQASLGV